MTLEPISSENICEEKCEEVCEKVCEKACEDVQKRRAKRDIFHFNGDKPTAINLEHVTHMSIEGNKITFNFYTNAIFIELENNESAETIFKALLTAWSADVLA